MQPYEDEPVLYFLNQLDNKLDRLLELLKPKRKRGRPPKGEADYPAEFEEIWQIYPKRA